MKTPREKYLNDPHYKQLVDVLSYQVEMARFTPSEIREAAIFACILYEQRRIPRYFISEIELQEKES